RGTRVVRLDNTTRVQAQQQSRTLTAVSVQRSVVEKTSSGPPRTPVVSKFRVPATRPVLAAKEPRPAPQPQITPRQTPQIKQPLARTPPKTGALPASKTVTTTTSTTVTKTVAPIPPRPPPPLIVPRPAPRFPPPPPPKKDKKDDDKRRS